MAQSNWTPVPAPVSQEPYDIGSFEWSDEDTNGEEKKRTVFDPQQWRQFTLKFGKYKGMNLLQMTQKSRTRGYLRWLMKCEGLYDGQKECFAEALKFYERHKSQRQRVKANRIL